jgi:hypothetical protein
VRVSPKYPFPNNLQYVRTATNADARKTIVKEVNTKGSDPRDLEKSGYTKFFMRAESGKLSLAICKMS